MNTQTVIAVAVALGALLGCERAEDAAEETDGAREAAEAYFEALQYGDATRAFAMHVDATPMGAWCGSSAFKAVLERVRQGKNPQECARARVILEQAPDEVDAQERTLLQAMRFVCEVPEGRCHDYARGVFLSHQAQRERERGALTDFEITRALPGAERGKKTLYVKLSYERGDARRAVATVRRTPLGWRVVGDPGGR